MRGLSCMSSPAPDVSISALRIRLETLAVLSVDASGTITLSERGLPLRNAVS